MNSDRGVVTAFVLGLVLAFVVLAGLAVDSGRLVAAHVTAGDHAENAARAGAHRGAPRCVPPASRPRRDGPVSASPAPRMAG